MKSICLLLVLITLNVFSQASITALVCDQDKMAYPAAKCFLIENDSVIIGKIGGLDGKVKFENLQPSSYSLKVTGLGMDTVFIKDVVVLEDNIRDLDTLFLSWDTNFISSCFGGCCGPMPIQINNDLRDGNKSVTITKDDILNLPALRPGGIIDTFQEIVILDYEEPEIIRGGRPGDGIYFVDGVKSEELSNVPLSSIERVKYYNGGIPAKYGDTTTGAIIISTLSYFDLYYSSLYK